MKIKSQQDLSAFLQLIKTIVLPVQIRILINFLYFRKAKQFMLSVFSFSGVFASAPLYSNTKYVFSIFLFDGKFYDIHTNKKDMQ